MANLVEYIYNDPSTIALIGPVTLTRQSPSMPFIVEGLQAGPYAMYSLEHQAACCYYTVANAVLVAQRYLKTPLRGWSSTQLLTVSPRAGRQLNAYYDRLGLKFFYALDPIAGKTVFTSNSTDVVCHEAGHAILDAIRPDLYNMQAMEIWAFHEAFGDIHAIINTLQHDVVLDSLLKETGGNIKQSCSVSKLAEEMGSAIFHLTGGRRGYTDGVLRNAFNAYTYIAPEKLRANCPDNQLCSEPHNFSRIFTGAWYDILCGIFEDQKNKQPTLKAALKTAVDILATYTFQAMPIVAATIRFYDAVARAMLVIDKANNYMYNQLMNEVFLARAILREPVKPMIATDWTMFKTQGEIISETIEHDDGAACLSKSNQLLPLPYYMVNVHVPGDAYFEFNGTGECINIINSSAEELIEHAHLCVDYLTNGGLIRADKGTPFEIDKNGNLLRSHFSCGCGSGNSESGGSGSGGCGCRNNCHVPGQPEFGKCWKLENNAGCGCNGTSSCVTTSTQPTIIVERNVR